MAMWQLSWTADPVSVALANRHYSRQNPSSNQFMPPGRQLVLRTPEGDAVWGTAWPYARYVNRVFPGAWICTIFRNESPHLSSDMVREACAITRWKYGDPPEEGMITLIDESKTRHKRDPGRCYRKAGFTPAGRTKGGLFIVRLAPSDFPDPIEPMPRAGLGQMALTLV